MHTRETERDVSLGAAAKQFAERASTLVRLEAELAALEVKRKLASLGLGIGLALAAAVLFVFALAFALATIAAAIATTMSVWAALLIMTGGLLLIGGLLGFFGMRAIQKGSPPVPEQAIREAKLTTEALKHNGR